MPWPVNCSMSEAFRGVEVPIKRSVLHSAHWIFLVVWWLVSGVPLLDALKAIFAIIAITGFGSWVLSGIFEPKLIHSVTVGLPIGLACVGFLPIFISHKHLPIAFGAVVVLGLSTFFRQCTNCVHKLNVRDISVFLLTCTFTSIELLDRTSKLQIFALYALIGLAGICTLTKKLVKLGNLVLILTLLLCVWIAFVQNGLPIGPASLQSSLYFRTNDNVFSESISNSIANFGLDNLSAATGTPIKYHFLTLSISGIFSRSLDLAPFVMTLQIIPSLAFMVIAFQIATLARQVGGDRRSSIAALYILFLSNTLPNQIRFFSTNTTTNTLSCVFVLAVLLILKRHLRIPTIKSTLLLILMSISSILSKSPYGALLGLGFVALSLALPFSNKHNWFRLFATLVASILAMAASLLFLVKPPSWAHRSFEIDFSSQGLGGAAGPAFFVIPLSIGFFILCRFGLLLLYRNRHKSQPTRQLVVFMISLAIGGLLAFVVDNQSNELYFLNLALLVSAPIAGVGLINGHRHLTQTLQQKDRRLIAITSAIFIFIGTLMEFAPLFDQVSSRQLLLPLLWLALAIVFLAFLYTARFCKFDLRGLCAIGLIGLTIGTFTSQVRSRLFNSPVLPSYSIAQPELVQGILWLKSTSQENDLIATNHSLPCVNLDCVVDESSMLISALSHQQVLIEGPRFVVGDTNYPPWIVERIRLSLDPILTPSKSSLESLIKVGVTRYLLDLSHPSVREGQLEKLISIIPPSYTRGNVMVFDLQSFKG